MTKRAQIVQEARSWIGTPSIHQACLKGIGVDCDHLVIGVARALGLVAPDFDVPPYPRFPDGVTMLQLCRTYMDEIEQQDMLPGDIVVLRLDAEPQHMGILGDYRHGGLSIIHASSESDPPRVIETRLLFTRDRRFAAAFSLRGVS